MAKKFLISVLWASTFAVPTTAQAKLLDTAVAAVLQRKIPQRIFKNSGKERYEIVDCVNQLPDGSFRMVMSGEEAASCRLGFTSGVQIRLDKGEIVTTERKGTVIHGIVRIYTSGVPYRVLGDQIHLIRPNATVDVIVENNLTYILSREGNTSVVACGGDKATCQKRELTLFQGEKIILTKSGQVYDWRNSEGEILLQEEGGCKVASSGNQANDLWLILVILMAIRTQTWLKRQRQKCRDS